MTELVSTQVRARGIDPRVDALDFAKLRWKLGMKDEGKGWDEETLARVELEYRRFLTLLLLYPERDIVPTREIDEFWHAHILDTRKYAEDCAAAFGRFVHHYPYFGIHDEVDQQNLRVAFAETRDLCRECFGEDYGSEDAARCQDHPCHAPSDCACRAAGTCK